MTVFRQLPAWSPLTLGALWSGFRAAWLTDGREARRALDEALREMYSPRQLYTTDSGTSALTLALQVVKAVTKAPVALPAYCCYDVATAADGAGVEFFLYDLDPTSLSPDLASLRRAFEGGARSVVVAHLYGVPVDLAAVQALAAEFGAVIIEDAAQGSGCEWKGRPAGGHGALGILSFGRGKGVTGGKGGALLVNDEALTAASAKVWAAASGPKAPHGSLRDLLLLAAQWAFGRPRLYWIPAGLPFLGLGETVYRTPRPIGGISSLAAGVLNRIRKLIPVEVAHRRMTAESLKLRISGVAHFEPPQGWTAGWLRYPVLLPGSSAATLSSRHRAAGMMAGYPELLADLVEFGAQRQNLGEPLEGARVLAVRLTTIPTHRSTDHRIESYSF